MLVSVIIPNYNYASFIPSTVESVVRQSYRDIELLVVDDGSVDDSRSVITNLAARYSERFRRVELVFIEQNGGKLHALNQTIPRAGGGVVLILDSDDCLDRECLTRTVGRLVASRAENEKVAFVYTDCWLVDAEGKVLTRGTSSPFNAAALETNSYIPECAPTFTEALKGALPFDERIKVGTKHHKWKRLVAAGWEGEYLAEPLFYYRMHQRNLSGIGAKLLAESDYANSTLRILSGYWPTVAEKEEN